MLGNISRNVGGGGTSYNLDNRYLPIAASSGVAYVFDKAVECEAKNYRVYGNSVQNGEPSPEAPIEVNSVGDLVTEGEHAGKYRVEVNITGRNLLNIDDISELTYEKKGTASKAKGVLFKAPGTYTLKSNSLGAGDGFIYAYILRDGKITSDTIYVATNNRSDTRTVTVADGESLMVVDAVSGDTLEKAKFFFGDRQIQVEFGAAATEYEKFAGVNKAAVYLDEPLRKINNSADYIDYESGKVIRNVGKLVLNSEAKIINYNPETQFNSRCFYVSFPNSKLGYGTSLCTHFQNVKNGNPFTPASAVEGIYCDHVTMQNKYFDWGTNEATAAQFKAWLDGQADAGTPVTVWYELASPIGESIVTGPLKTREGVNSVFAATEVQPSDIVVEHHQNPTEAIEELRNAIIALGGNI